MKKIFLLFLSCVLSILVYSNVDLSGHFRMDLSKHNIPVNDISDYFNRYLDLPDNTAFQPFRDETDPMGYRHISYLQYVNGSVVSNAMVLVHAYNDIVLSMNGDVFTKAHEAASANQTIRFSQRHALKKASASTDHAPIVMVKVIENEGSVYHKAYKVKADFNKCYKYIDVYTGEVIKEESLVYNADVVGTAYTMYNGTQSFTCYSINDAYYLHDEGKNFATYDATHAASMDYSLSDINQILEKYRLSCSEFSNSSTTWNETYHRYLAGVNIYSLPCWTTQVDNVNPNIYLKIYDSAGNLLCTTESKDNVVFPASFAIPTGVESLDGRFLFEIYEHNSINDERLTTFTTNVVTSVYDIPFSDSTVTGSLHFVPSGQQQPALDVHWGMQKTLDFYRQILNRNGHDNRGGPVYQFYNPAPDTVMFLTMPSNAFAYSGTIPNIMVYGEGMLTYGSTTSMGPVVALDVMAHEFTHLVTANNGNGGLLYEDESGALNESFSDIMAMAVVDYVKDSCDWEIGADIMINVPNMRSMSDPNTSGFVPQPKYYKGNYWATLGDYSKTGDNGGVHTNSGIQNYWFYLLAHGGSGTNEAGKSFSVTGIGIEDAVKIAYYNLLYYLSPSASFVDSRWGTVQACAELFGASSSQMQTVVDAWDAVGVVDDSPERDCKSLPFTESFASDQGEFVVENVALDGLDYVWQFASGYGMKASAYVGDVNHPTESWLISPCLEFPDDAAITLTFDHVYRYTTTPTTDLTLLVSEDYVSGSPSSATWTAVAVPAYSSGDNWTFVNAGNINLDAYAGKNVTLAFRYSSSNAAAATWEIKNVSVTSVPFITGIDNVFNRNNATKCVIDGHLFIFRDGHKFTATGTMVE